MAEDLKIMVHAPDLLELLRVLTAAYLALVNADLFGSCTFLHHLSLAFRGRRRRWRWWAVARAAESGDCGVDKLVLACEQGWRESHARTASQDLKEEL